MEHIPSDLVIPAHFNYLNAVQRLDEAHKIAARTGDFAAWAYSQRLAAARELVAGGATKAELARRLNVSNARIGILLNT